MGVDVHARRRQYRRRLLLPVTMEALHGEGAAIPVASLPHSRCVRWQPTTSGRYIHRYQPVSSAGWGNGRQLGAALYVSYGNMNSMSCTYAGNGLKTNCS